MSSDTTHWNWGIFFEQTPYSDGTIYLDWLWSGILVTISLSICAWIIAFIIGSFFGVLRTLPNKYCRFIGAAYVELFRNVPLLVQFFVWVMVIPTFLPQSAQNWLYVELTPEHFAFIFASIALGLFTGARICEQVKTAIEALPRGQKSAAFALGLTLPQAYIHILLPNAYRRVLPPLTSEMLNMVKNSAVASMIGLLDLSGQANNLLENSQQAYESFIAVTVSYIILNFIVMTIMRIVEKKTRLPGMFGGK